MFSLRNLRVRPATAPPQATEDMTGMSLPQNSQQKVPKTNYKHSNQQKRRSQLALNDDSTSQQMDTPTKQGLSADWSLSYGKAYQSGEII